eukprot:c43048_g1_i1.p1 GENE.c43048_g1_i1~~c43048_g1_i1.p1  ORF type:complete len:243 (-),score=58.33 c43048_g1_i1:153-881(-)
MERATILKVSGILLSFGGVVFMLLFDNSSKSSTDHKSGAAQFAGNAMFFLNCLGTAIYIVASKPLLRRYHAVMVTGYSYFVACVGMFVACIVVTQVPKLLDLVCPSSDGGCGNGWNVPTSAIPALAYWVLFTSIFSYCLMTWGNKYADPSLVCAYTVLQPVSSSALAYVIIALTAKPHYNLKGPTLGDLGVVGIAAGLTMVIFDARRNRNSKLREEARLQRIPESVRGPERQSLLLGTDLQE